MVQGELPSTNGPNPSAPLSPDARLTVESSAVPPAVTSVHTIVGRPKGAPSSRLIRTGPESHGASYSFTSIYLSIYARPHYARDFAEAVHRAVGPCIERDKRASFSPDLLIYPE